MPIEFSPETKKRLLETISNRLRERAELDIGVLQAEIVYDVVVGLVGAAIYNQAISDAQAWMQAKVLDLEGDLHEDAE